MNKSSCRGGLIAPTADLSALGWPGKIYDRPALPSSSVNLFVS
ncbi:MAG TPA: hypothetical protein VKV20_18485 [Ktedonobacteraceae bacterium]|nr:hypothetical protein [Ktedonobacteraceae bacterium]